VIYSKKGKYARAEGEYERALDLHPRFPAALYNLGKDLLQQGEYRKAVRFFTKAIRLYPTDIWALNNRGLAQEKRGKVEKARRDFEAALVVDPGFETARANLERIMAESGDPRRR
jgi:tetratricopeptide (TPR) repeat protein